MTGVTRQASMRVVGTRAQELAVRALGQAERCAPARNGAGTKGQPLSVVELPSKAGIVVSTHEAGIGGGLVDLVCRFVD